MNIFLQNVKMTVKDKNPINLDQLTLRGSSIRYVILPETLQFLPLYILSLVKHITFRTGTDIRLDERAFGIYRLKMLPCNLLMQYLYPKLFNLTFLPENAGNVDSNDNKKWDTGNFLKRIQPEKVVYFPQEFKLRANWIQNEIFSVE